MTTDKLATNEPIYEEHEVCAVCGGTKNLGLWDDEITVCNACYADGNLKSKFAVWLENEIMGAVASSPDFEQLPNGKYRRRVEP